MIIWPITFAGPPIDDADLLARCPPVTAGERRAFLAAVAAQIRGVADGEQIRIDVTE